MASDMREKVARVEAFKKNIEDCVSNSIMRGEAYWVASELLAFLGDGEPVVWVTAAQIEHLKRFWGGEIPSYKDSSPLYLHAAPQREPTEGHYADGLRRIATGDNNLHWTEVGLLKAVAKAIDAAPHREPGEGVDAYYKRMEAEHDQQLEEKHTSTHREPGDRMEEIARLILQELLYRTDPEADGWAEERHATAMAYELELIKPDQFTHRERDSEAILIEAIVATLEDDDLAAAAKVGRCHRFIQHHRDAILQEPDDE